MYAVLVRLLLLNGCFVVYYGTTKRQAGRGRASRMRHGVWMGIQYASRSKVVAYTVVVVFAGVIASIAILLAGWLRVFAAAGRRTGSRATS